MDLKSFFHVAGDTFMAEEEPPPPPSLFEVWSSEWPWLHCQISSWLQISTTTEPAVTVMAWKDMAWSWFSDWAHVQTYKLYHIYIYIVLHVMLMGAGFVSAQLRFVFVCCYFFCQLCHFCVKWWHDEHVHQTVHRLIQLFSCIWRPFRARNQICWVMCLLSSLSIWDEP